MKYGKLPAVTGPPSELHPSPFTLHTSHFSIALAVPACYADEYIPTFLTPGRFMPQTLRLIVLACFVACFAAPPALRAGVAMPPALSNEISQLKVNWQSVQVRMNWTNERTSSISLNLQGFLPEDITDRLVGYRVDIDELNDADGVSLLPKDENGQSRPSKGSMTFMAPPLKGGNIARIAGQRVAVNLRDIQMPSGPLSDVRGRIRLLTAVEYHNVDLPLKEGASVELTPGLTLHLEKVAQGGRQRTISFRIESDRPELKLGERGHAPFIWSFQVLGDNNAVDDRGLYAASQSWINKEHVIGRAKGYLPYVSHAALH